MHSGIIAIHKIMKKFGWQTDIQVAADLNKRGDLSTRRSRT